MERFYKMVEASNKRFPEGVQPIRIRNKIVLSERERT